MPTPDWDITLTNTEKAEIYSLVAQEIRLLKTALEGSYDLKLLALNISRELEKKDKNFDRKAFLEECGGGFDV